MCEILIKAIDASCLDAEKDKMLYKQGDAVVIFEDGHEWGSEESLPLFWVVRIAGLAADALKTLLAAQIDDNDPQGRPARRRLYALDFASLPASWRASLTTTGTLDVTLQQARSYIKNKQTGASF